MAGVSHGTRIAPERLWFNESMEATRDRIVQYGSAAQDDETVKRS